MTRKSITLVGAAAGLALFLAVALLPSLVYGGYAGVMLAGLLGTPIEASGTSRAAIVLGMVVGVGGVGALFTAAGAACGAAIAALTRASPAAARQEAPSRVF